MAWSIDNEQTRNIYLYFKEAFAFVDLFDKFFLREEGGTDLLGNTSGFSLLDVGMPDLIEKSGFSGIDVT